MLGDWESPGDLDAAAQEVKDRVGRFVEIVQDAHHLWANLSLVYSGPDQEVLYSGLDQALDHARVLDQIGAGVREALSVFATDLGVLQRQREQLVADVGDFNARYGGVEEGDADRGVVSYADELAQMGYQLQQRYEQIVDECVMALAAVRFAAGSAGGAGGVGASAHGGAGCPWGEFVRGQVLEGVGKSVGEGLKGLEAPGVVRESGFVHSAWQVGGSYQEQSVPVRSSSTPVGVSLFGLPIGSTRPGEYMQALMNDRAAGGTWQERLSRNFVPRLVGNLPGGAEFQAWGASSGRNVSRVERLAPVSTDLPGGEGRVSSVREVTTRVEGPSLRLGLQRGIASAGTVGTVVSSGLAFSQTKQAREAQLAEQNPGMSEQELEVEANHAAGAHTVGSVGSSIAASAAAGAAVGSVVPGAGTLAGLAAGLVTGLVMEAPLLPDFDGDGQRDSLADLAGTGVEKLWGGVREAADGAGEALAGVGQSVAEGVSDAGLGVVDAVSSAGEALAQSRLNPLNWS